MTAESSAFQTPIDRVDEGARAIFVWSVEDPDLHARYRIEWKFRVDKDRKNDERVGIASPSEVMAKVGVVQDGDPILSTPAARFDLPAEAEDARRVVAHMVATMERVRQVHSFAKGMGIAAPQVGIGRSAAVVRTADGESITLLNPRIIDESSGTDEQYEGCLSFFDVRGIVPRARIIEVEHQDVGGHTLITVFEKGVARLVAHEVDHLHGVFYRARMRPGVELIPVAQYRGTGESWTYQ